MAEKQKKPMGPADGVRTLFFALVFSSAVLLYVGLLAGWWGKAPSHVQSAVLGGFIIVFGIGALMFWVITIWMLAGKIK